MRLRPRSLSVVTCLSLLVVACGGGEEPAPTVTATEDVAAPAPTEEAATGEPDDDGEDDEATDAPDAAFVEVDGESYEVVDVCADWHSDGGEAFVDLGPGGWYVELRFDDLEGGSAAAILHEAPEAVNSLAGGDITQGQVEVDGVLLETGQGELWGDGETRYSIDYALPLQSAPSCLYGLAYDVETAEAKGEDEDARISWDMEYPQLVATGETGQEIVDAVNAAIFQNMAIEDLPPSPTEDDPEYDGPAWSRWVRYEIDLQTPRLLSLSYTEDFYMGGPHGNPMVHTLHFDLMTGERVEFTDLFETYEGGVAEILSPYVKAGLDEQFGEDGHDGTDTVLFDVSWEGTVTPTELVIRIQTYQVGPYAIGSPEVRIWYPDVSEDLPPSDLLHEALSWTVG